MATITRNSIAADQAAKQASDAARVLQSRGQESKAQKAEQPEPQVESRNEPEVSEKDPRGTPERVKAHNPVRAQAMDEIRSKRGEKTPEQTEPTNIEATTPEPAKVTEQVVEPTSATQQTITGLDQSQTPADAAAAAEPIKTVKVKVDGEEFDVPQTDVDEAGGVKAFQTQRASENRLKKANEALAQVRQMQEQVVQFTRQQLPQPKPQISDAEFMASKMEAIRYGTPEEGAAAMQEIISRNRPQFDQNSITNHAVTQMNYQGAVKQFLTEFADISSNPIIMRSVESLAAERLAAIPNDPVIRSQVDWNDFYRRIGNEVRSVVGRPSQSASVPAAQPTGNSSQVSTDKEARKASIVNLPTAATRATLPEETKPETREQSLERMKKARGLPTG
tara:strand:- start:9 stop:1184 length:1176 start_codon:yes stop_codon:yes gene_type:complete